MQRCPHLASVKLFLWFWYRPITPKQFHLHRIDFLVFSICNDLADLCSSWLRYWTNCSLQVMMNIRRQFLVNGIFNGPEHTAQFDRRSGTIKTTDRKDLFPGKVVSRPHDHETWQSSCLYEPKRKFPPHSVFALPGKLIVVFGYCVNIASHLYTRIAQESYHNQRMTSATNL